MRQGLQWLKEGKLSEAEKSFAAALEKAKQFGRGDPRYAQSLNELALVVRQRGDYASAEALFREALPGLRASGTQQDMLTATTMCNLGDVLRVRGKYLDAEVLLRQAVAIQEKILGNDHIDVSASYMALGALHVQRREYTRAFPLLRRALFIRERAARTEPGSVVLTLCTLATTHIYCGQYRKADELLGRALVIAKHAGPTQPRMARILGTLGASAERQLRYGEAEDYLRQAIQIWEEAGVPRHADVASALSNLGIVYLALGKHVSAEEVLSALLTLRRKRLGRTTRRRPALSETWRQRCANWAAGEKLELAKNAHVRCSTAMLARILQVWCLTCKHTNVNRVAGNGAVPDQKIVGRHANCPAQEQHVERPANGIFLRNFVPAIGMHDRYRPSRH